MTASADCFQVEKGVKVAETHEFIWKIRNFAELVKKGWTRRRPVNSKHFDFCAGETLGLSSKWRVFFRSNGRHFVGIHLRMMKQPKSNPECLLASCAFSVRSGTGKTDFIPASAYCTSVENMCTRTNGELGLGFVAFLRTSGPGPYLGEILDSDGILKICINFTIYPSPTPRYEEVQKRAESFNQSHFYRWDPTNRVLDFVSWNWPRLEDTNTKVTIISRDGVPFYMWKEVLQARSPVFEAMLTRCDMKERATRVVKLTDLSAKTLRILLHYLCCLVLLPGWEEEEVVVELTYAAGKYLLEELLQFLDSALGKVCEVGNVQELLLLAEGLELKTAEEELIELVVEKEWLDSNSKEVEAEALAPVVASPPDYESMEEKVGEYRSESGWMKGLLGLFLK